METYKASVFYGSPAPLTNEEKLVKVEQDLKRVTEMLSMTLEDQNLFMRFLGDAVQQYSMASLREMSQGNEARSAALKGHADGLNSAARVFTEIMEKKF